MGNSDLWALSVQADFAEISDVGGVSVSKQERRKSRMDIVERDVTDLKDMRASYLTRAVDMFCGNEMADREKILADIKDIAELNVGEERLKELNGRLVD